MQFTCLVFTLYFLIYSIEKEKNMAPMKTLNFDIINKDFQTMEQHILASREFLQTGNVVSILIV